MGKKAKMKVIRQIAAQLPAMQTRGFEKNRVTGVHLIQNGLSVIKSGANGEIEETIRRSTTYIESKPVAVGVNHARRLRKIHKQLGVPGIKAYVKYVEKSLQTQLAKADANHS